jgi:hypothetical protein
VSGDEPAKKACLCGWQRPLIALTTLTGDPPPANVVPVYLCPCCGVAYMPPEIPERVGLSIFSALVRRAGAN